MFDLLLWQTRNRIVSFVKGEIKFLFKYHNGFVHCGTLFGNTAVVSYRILFGSYKGARNVFSVYLTNIKTERMK